MAVEKVFAIRASPEEIFAAIERDLTSAGEHHGETHTVLRRDPPRAIDLRVTIAGITCMFGYRLDERDGHTEVTGTLDPYGWKYAFFRIMTFGRDQGFEIALVESLANLKAAVEEEPESFPDEDDGAAAPEE